MCGYVYRFESVSAETILSPSQTAGKILSAASYYVRGIRFHELTDQRNPRSLFAVLFAHPTAKRYFDEVFECLLERTGLRVEILRPIEGESLAQIDLGANAANATEFERHRASRSGNLGSA